MSRTDAQVRKLPSQPPRMQPRRTVPPSPPPSHLLVSRMGGMLQVSRTILLRRKMRRPRVTLLEVASLLEISLKFAQLIRVDIEVLCLLSKGIPINQSAECPLLMRRDDAQAQHVTGIDPAKAIVELAIISLKSPCSAYPSRGMPLKSDPWFPYSAFTFHPPWGDVT